MYLSDVHVSHMQSFNSHKSVAFWPDLKFGSRLGNLQRLSQSKTVFKDLGP